MSQSTPLRRALLSAVAACTLFGHCADVMAHSASDPPPKKVAILVFDQVAIIDYSGPYEVFSRVGYDVFTVAETGKPILTEGGMKIMPKYNFANAPQADIVVIPGGGFEAKPNSATTAWIQKESLHDEHTMSVCNGAFTLANTGLLDGQSATTTAGNILRLRHTYPQIKVVNDRRVVDNGKILTTAGLSAGIDGALHLVSNVEGEDVARTVALFLEYNWQPDDSFVRGAMADRLIPDVDLGKTAQWVDMRLKGDRDQWETRNWFTTQLSADELFAEVQAAYQKSYAEDGPWSPNSFRITASGPLKAELHFDDRDGGHWQGSLSLEPVAADAHKFIVRIATARAA
jgi:putative intracellular protease/amidase